MDTTTVPVKVAGELIIRLKDLPPMALELIKSSLTIPNEEREKMAALDKFGWWDLPETVALYRTETRRGGEEVICLPRGTAMGLAALLGSVGFQVEWDDQRTKAPAKPGYYRPILLRDYQSSAATKLLVAEQGVYKAPAGAGKTVTVLGLLATVQQRALIIVDKIGLANQWRVRAHQFYGMQLEQVTKDDGTTELVAPLEGDHVAGFIGQGVWEERDLTIALRQTLVERSWSADATNWWSKWGATFLDEVHHAAAEGLGDIGRKTTSFYFGGVSATPAKSEAKGAKVYALLGPIVAETTRHELYERGVLMKAVVEVLQGDFFHQFWPDHSAKFDNATQRWTCEKPGCKMQKKHRHNNNYSSVLKALVEDPERNRRIAERVMSERGHVHLMPSGQLKHLNLIKKAIIAAGWPEDKIWLLRGEENAKGLDQVIVKAVLDSDEGVLLSTVANEALDIPPIDRVHISFPMRDRGATIQLVGRGERVCEPRKTDAIVVDYREPKVDVLEGQYSERDRTYRMEGLDIVPSPYSVMTNGGSEDA